MRLTVAALLVLSACSVTSQDSDKVGMMCVRGHDEVVGEYDQRVEVEPSVEFVCDEYSPSPAP